MRISSWSLGAVFVQPEKINEEDISASSVVICPHRIRVDEFDVIVEWAAGSQVPIFCHSRDIPRMVEVGFGAYRFHGISGYREVSFQGGSVEFFPGRHRKAAGLVGLVTEAADIFGLIKPSAYHVLLRPRHGRPVLFLCSPQIDVVEWKVLTSSNPSMIIGSAAVADLDWDRLARLYGRQILKARQHKIFPEEGIEPEGTRKVRSEAWVQEADCSS